MKKKIIFLMLIFSILCIGGGKINSLNAEETITIGEGGDVSSSYAPIYNDYTSYALTQTLYLSDEIGVDAGLISSISFNSKIAGGLTRNIAIYLKNTDKDHYTGTKDWVVLTSEDEPVFEGEIVTPTTTGWYTIQFETPFEYTGGNLAVTINDKTGTYDSSKHDEWWAYSTGGDDAAKRTLYVTGWSSAIDYLNLSASYGSYDYVNQGTYMAPVYVYKNPQVKLTITAAEASVEVGPSEIALGETMLGNYWMENKPSQEVSIRTISTSVTSVTSSNPFFTVPNNIDFTTNPVVFNVGYDVNATAGEKEGVLTITYGDGETETVNMTATAYTPGEGDVWELAKEVTEYPFEETPAYANIHANYNLPGNGDAGKDVVYELNFTGDVLLTASVEGANAKLAVYQEDFGGQGGPKADNNYEGLQNDNGGGSSAPTTFGPFDFSDESFLDIFDSEGWSVYNNPYSNSEDGRYYLSGRSAGCNLVTKTKYVITSQSKLSFSYDNFGYGATIVVALSTDGINFVNKVEIATTGNNPINLSDYAADEEVYISIKMINDGDGIGCSIDNLALTDGSAKSRSVAQTRADENQIEGVQFSEGKYYLVASATEEFTINIATDEVPAPAEFALTAPEDNAREQNNPKLAWEAAKYALSYNVYIGTSSDLSDAELVEVTTNSYQTENLSNNTKYYWTVEAVNEQGTTPTTSEVWSFVTTLNKPTNVAASETNLYPDDEPTITWTAAEGATNYNVYVGETKVASGVTSPYTLSGLDYNVDPGHNVTVTANHTLGESAKSDAVVVKMTGSNDITGTITNGAGATLTFTGTDEFGEPQTFTKVLDDDQYTINVLAGTYTVTASKFDYQDLSEELEVIYAITLTFDSEMTAYPAADASLLSNVAVTEVNEEAEITWTGAFNITQMYNIYRKNVETGVVELVAENQNNTNQIYKSYTDETYSELEDGTYQYGVRTMVDVDEVILNEGFESGKFPEGWINNRVYYNYVYNGWALKPSDAHNGTYCIENCFSQSYYTVSLETSTIDLTSYPSATLSFYYVNKPYNSNYKQSTIRIKVKKQGGNWVTVETISENVANYSLCEISLNDYVGNQIQIAFECYTSAWGYSRIDDIVLSVGSKTESATVWSNEIKKGGIVFTNNDGNSWHNSLNWSNGIVPGEEDEVTIMGSAVISSDVNVKYLAISGGALTINEGATLTVTGELVNNDEYRLTINDGAQLFHNSNNVKASFTMGIVNPGEWNENNKTGWQFIASPFVNNTAPIANFTSPNYSTIVYDLYKYNGVVDGQEWDNQKDNHLDQSWLYFNQGEGYLASYETLETATLSGTLNSGVTYSWDNLTYNNSKDLANFHLLGNPFTFNMDMNNATFTNMVQGVAIVTAQGGYNYEVTSIPVGDGFFVKATNENPSFSYNAASKATRGEKANSLNVIATSNAGNDNVVINFAGEQEGFPKMRNFNDAIATVYVQDKGANYGIYNCDENTTEVELCFNANQMGNYTISIEPNGKFQTVTLVDRFTGIETNMLLEDYSFTAMSEENNNRFILKMVNGQQTTDNSHFVFQSGEDLIIDAEGTVQIIDMMGRVVYNNDVTSDNNRINVSDFNNGAYVVRVINESEIKVEKVVIY